MDKDGRRVFVRRRSRGAVYLVPDDAVDRIARGVYWNWVVTVTAMVVSLLLVGRSAYWLLGIVAASTASRFYSKRLLSSLAPAGVSVGDLPPIDAGSRRTRTRAAYGRRHYVDLALGGTLMALLGGTVLLSATWRRQDAPGLFSGAFITVFGVYLIVSSVSALRELRGQPTPA